MLRSALSRGLTACSSLRLAPQAGVAASRTIFGEAKVNYDEVEQRYVDYFNRPDIDGWEVRKGMTELQGQDFIADPKVVAAALRACRRVNDYALAVRFLEGMYIKCGTDKRRKTVYPWIIQEVRPVLDELGIDTPEDLGFDKPELFVPDATWWWERSWYKEYGYDKNPRYADAKY